MNGLVDVRYAIRSLAKSPLFTGVAVLSIALGIGANSAVFTLLDQVLLRALPVHDPDALAQLSSRNFYGSNTGMHAFSYPMYQDLTKQNQVFTGMLCRHSLPFSASFAGHNERVYGEIVSGTYFPVLGVKAEVGRLFTSADDASRGGAPYAVLGYDYWMSRFAGDRSIVGRDLLVNDHKLSIIGVAARQFEGLEPIINTQIYVPLAMAEQVTRENKPFEDRRRTWLQIFGRLKPGISHAEAQASLEPLFHNILKMEVAQPAFATASPYAKQQFLQKKLKVMPGRGGHSMVKQFLEAPLWAMMGMVALVLLIACANVANLLIARGAARQKEIAVRLALGAGRAQLIAQLVVESLLLAAMGAAAGLFIGAWSMRLLVRIMPQDIDPPLRFAVNPDWRVMLFALMAALATALLFSLAPAWQLTRTDLAPTLKDQASAVAGGGHARWRKALVCAQVALSLLLLIDAGLFVGTLRNLKDLNPGFAVSNLVSFSVDPTLNGYDAERCKLFYRQLQDNLHGMPGVDSAALAVVAPLNFDEWDSTVTVEGYASKPGEDMNPLENFVSPGYFDTLKIPLLAGRDFTIRDVVGAAKVAIVNEKFARHYFGSLNVVGRRLGKGGDPGTKTDVEIVGVVANAKYQTMREEFQRQVFYPYLQNTWANQMAAFVRTNRSTEDVFPALRAELRKLDANLPLFGARSEERTVNDVLAVERLAASLSTAFAVVATLLAAIGLYGVMAFLVTRRTREIGLRMALGAEQSSVIWLVVREVLLLVAVGAGVGLPLALGVVNLLRSQLFGLSPFDVPTIIWAVLGILLVAAISGYLPARRATRIDPVTALRYD